MTKNEELLEEAKRRYPIGTKFIPAHLLGKESACEVYDYKGLSFQDTSNPVNIELYSFDDRNKNSYTGMLMYLGKWAEIISSPKVEEKEVEMIEGNWYELQAEDKWLYKYTKNGAYKSANDVLGKKTEFSICIDTKNKFKSISNWITEGKNIKSIKPANLEEVYKYFPEERPKVEDSKRFKFEKGKYYSFIQDKGDKPRYFLYVEDWKEFGVIADYYRWEGQSERLNKGQELHNTYKASEIKEVSEAEAKGIKEPKYEPQMGSYFTTEGKGIYSGRIMIGKFVSRHDSFRCNGPLISDFNHKGTFLFTNTGYWCYKQETGKSDERIARVATSDEITWLDKCISFGKFIPKEEALKPISSIPEYVEVKAHFFVEKEEIGKIYKTSDPFPTHLKECSKFTWEKVFKDGNGKYFPASTKEAYDSQFKAKEPVMEKEAIHCKTQEEWDIVTNFHKISWTTAKWSDYKQESCINIARKSYMNKEWYVKSSYKVLSFQEWASKVGYKKAEESLVGRYLKAIKPFDFFSVLKPGDYIKIIKGHSSDLKERGKCLEVEKYGSFAPERVVRTGEFELMPVGFSPEVKLDEGQFYKFKVGDKVIGNSKCNKKYNITKEGWIGEVTKVEAKSFRAKKIGESSDWELEYEYFDLYEPSSSYRIAVDPYTEVNLEVSSNLDIFKSKKPAKMSYFAENTQKPGQLVNVQKSKTIKI